MNIGADEHHPPLKTQHVFILFDKPVRPYSEIGLVSSLGGRFNGDGDTYEGIRIAAAQRGADGVSIQDSGPQNQRDYWQYLKTSGIAIKYIKRYPLGCYTTTNGPNQPAS
jgi:hypothetical protein